MSKGYVLRIERMSTSDGDGIRTVVYLKGCPLRCLWCSTPESHKMEPEYCGDKLYGKVMEADELMKEISKDSIFFFNSGGGVTLSGGEVLMQPDFTAEIIRRSKEMCISTALETCMYGSFDKLEKMFRYLDLIYADIKYIDCGKHKELTGVGNEIILENLRRTAAHPDAPRLIIRMPVIPTVNDDDDNLRALARFCSENKGIEKVQLLPYHRLGLHSYELMNLEYPLKEIASPSEAFMAGKRAVIKAEAPELEVI